MMWIWRVSIFAPVTVALLTESVDRNYNPLDPATDAPVALLTESVDRNPIWHRVQSFPPVALLTESVDRNCKSW